MKLNHVALSNWQMRREIDEYKYLDIVERDKLKETDMKEKFASEYKKRFKIEWQK